MASQLLQRLPSQGLLSALVEQSSQLIVGLFNQTVPLIAAVIRENPSVTDAELLELLNGRPIARAVSETLPEQQLVPGAHVPGALAIPSTQPMVIPQLPSIPTIPSIPAIPSIPTSAPSIVPTPVPVGMPIIVPPSAPAAVPGLPSFVPSAIPSIPTGIPSIPTAAPAVPSIPFAIPQVPGIPSIPAAPVGIPSIPPVPAAIPTLPSLPPALPTLPSIPTSIPVPEPTPVVAPVLSETPVPIIVPAAPISITPVPITPMAATPQSVTPSLPPASVTSVAVPAISPQPIIATVTPQTVASTPEQIIAHQTATPSPAGVTGVEHVPTPPALPQVPAQEVALPPLPEAGPEAPIPVFNVATPQLVTIANETLPGVFWPQEQQFRSIAIYNNNGTHIAIGRYPGEVTQTSAIDREWSNILSDIAAGSDDARYLAQFQIPYSYKLTTTPTVLAA